MTSKCVRARIFHCVSILVLCHHLFLPQVRLHAASLNRREVWMLQGLYPGMKAGSIVGGDGCGTVMSVTDTNDNHSSWIGQRVVLNPCQGWGPSLRGPSPGFRTLGMLPLSGTFAEFCVVPVDRLERAPSHLSHEQVACLPTAGLTAFRAVVTQGATRIGILWSGARAHACVYMNEK